MWKRGICRTSPNNNSNGHTDSFSNRNRYNHSYFHHHPDVYSFANPNTHLGSSRP